MENAQLGALMSSETASFFPPHRRSHLKSETYRTLVRILSSCYDESQLSCSSQIQPIPDNYSNVLGRTAEKEVCSHSELVGPVRTDPENQSVQKEAVVDEGFDATSSQGRGFSDAPMVVDEIQRIMRIAENEDLLEEKDSTVDGSTEGIGSQDRGFGRQQMLMDELERIVKGNEEHVHDNSINLVTASFDKNQSGGANVAMLNNQEEHFDLQRIVMEKSRNADQLQVDRDHYSQNVNGAIHSCLDKDISSEVIEPNKNSKDSGFLLQTSMLEVEHEMQQNAVELKKSVCSNGAMNPPSPVAEGENTEEGEIAGDFAVNDNLIDLLFEGAVASKGKKVDEEQIFDGLITRDEFPPNRKNNRANEKDSESASFLVEKVDKGRDIEVKGSVRKKEVNKPEMVVHGTSMTAQKAHGNDSMLEAGRNENKVSGAKKGFGSPVACPKSLVFYGDILDENATQSQGVTSTDKQETGVCNKKKRGPRSKTKKKQKERKRRAEKNRELGVKRLKLHPVLKPVTVSYCHHYLKGRCQEGDKCKFSHDTVPLTKSMPCCHFARHSCMKGDDCPFDHELSKYPCSNYASRGFCSRSNCMFSHQMSDSTTASNACKPGLKSPFLPDDSNSKKQLNVSGTSHLNNDALSYSLGNHSHKNTKLNVVEALLKPAAMAPKGISFLSVGKSSSVDSSKVKQGDSFIKRDGSVKVRNQGGQSASGIGQNLNGIPKRTPPAAAPKGINFLSFGKAPLDNSSSKNLGSLPSHGNNGVELSLLDNDVMHKQANLCPKKEDRVEVGNQTSQRASKTAQNLNEIYKRTPSAATPNGISFLSFVQAPLENSISKKLDNLPSNGDDSIKLSLMENDSMHKQASVSSKKDDRVKVGNQTNHSALNTVQNPYEIVKKSQPAVSPREMNFISFGKVLKDDFSSDKKSSLPSSCDYVIHKPLKEGQSVLDNSQNSTAITMRLSNSPRASRLSSDCLAPAPKNTPNSAQKALWSTFAFAAKYESKNTPNSALAINTEGNKETSMSSTSGCPPTDSAKASKILDFLSRVGSKTNQ